MTPLPPAGVFPPLTAPFGPWPPFEVPPPAAAAAVTLQARATPAVTDPQQSAAAVT